MKNFFYIKKRSISKNQCKEIIDWFEENKERQDLGLIGGLEGFVVRPEIKESTDITLTLDEDNIVNKIIIPSLNEGFYEYQSEYPVLSGCADWNVDIHFNIQKYNPGGGYKDLHFEAANPLSSNRLFAWMFYLNDDWKGGTIFPYLNTKFRSSAGTLLIWPAGFTHSHKSQVTNKIKYIVTGWASFIDINN